MMWMFTLTNVLSASMQVLVCKEIYQIVGTKKDLKLVYRLCIILTIVAINVFAQIFVKQQIVFTLIVIALLVVYSYRFNISTPKRFTAFFFICALLILGEIAFTLLFGAIYNVTVSDIQNNIVIYIQAVLVSKLSCYAIVRIFGHFIKRRESTLSPMSLIMFIIAPITTCIVLYYLSAYVYSATENSIKIGIFIASLLLIVSNLITFLIFDFVLREKDKEKAAEAKALQLDYERQYYRDLYEKRYAENKVIHDIKNKMYSLQTLVAEKPTVAKREIDKICGVFDHIGAIKITGITAVDALLNAKQHEAEEYGIEVTTNSYISNVGISEIDLCVIFGNLLDNAIRACRMVSDGRPKKIELKIKQNRNYLIISVTNDMAQEKRAKILQPRDPQFHGYGLINVKEIVQKYNGETKHSIERDQFHISVLLEDLTEEPNAQIS